MSAVNVILAITLGLSLIMLILSYWIRYKEKNNKQKHA